MQLQRIHKRFHDLESRLRWVEQNYDMLSKTFQEDDSVWEDASSTGNIARFIKTSQEVKFMAEECTKQCMKDRNWRRDFAFFNTGGDIISDITSKSMQPATDSLGIRSPVGPEMAISGDASSGACWAFPGAVGQIGIRLRRRIVVQAVTIEHIGAKLAQNEIASAPKDFELYGIEGDGEDAANLLLLQGFYNITGPSTMQTFEVKEANFQSAHQKVVLKITSNHGNPEFTCLYRVRVHGKEA
ncbi:uncharacterized protein MELLADRAFT_86358 [Melampsora larici-populina 98AG31]|uniref:SUN domain-containing protein n=1 Tax=Melampsora larici-populina (strain 98AG31 / pathotype 3-4-7) TaxID=747676 RepID=F4R8L4_MELLP|nr:uncharacterized protein MELLADRAFT_92477 [Melampsora larici-populina 98AG31]XP_007409985.1 uncharacterized protein MELLADRAFT_86358 [Melampsora larici-populina 98AG31]EGG06545.1 hypothetical protein MELLADRAFT_86358 [Melampsora larici-populina 98AG31]EGG11091.1 hypothetical protein MELLADRAFT_92477 [Melampsora larici-populina 98AG31]